MDDDPIVSGLERIAVLDRVDTPGIDQLERRVRQRRTRRRVRSTALAALVLVGAAGAAAAIARPGGDDGVTVASQGGTTTPTVARPARDDRVFTVGAVPSSLAFQSCDRVTDEYDLTVFIGVMCTYDDPTTAIPDGLRLTRLIDGATEEVTRAWESGDATVAATAAGGATDPADSQFVTIAGTEVLSLGNPSGASYRLIVGDDLVELGTGSMAEDDIAAVVGGLSVSAPSSEVEAALVGLPRGSTVLVQGERPLWIQPDSLDPSGSEPFGGTTVGMTVALPDEARLVDVDITTGVDADGALDQLGTGGSDQLTGTEVAGQPALELSAGAMLPATVPGPRVGPQVLVAAGADTLVRAIGGPDDGALLRRAAAAIS